MSKQQELREKRGKLASDMHAILRKENITTEDRVKIQRLSDEIDVVGRAVELAEREEIADRMNNVSDGLRFQRFENPAQAEHRALFAKYLKFGEANVRRGNTRGLTEDERIRMWEYRDTDNLGQAAGTQSLSYTSLAAGGAIVPVGFQHEIDEALKYYCDFLNEDVCRVLATATGALLPLPTDNDTSNQAAILAENTSDTELGVSLGVVNLGAYKFSSRIIRVSLELIQDSAFNIEDYLKKKIAIRFARAYENYFTVGSGSNQPTGIVTAVQASGATPVVATGSSTNDGSTNTGFNSIGTNDLIALEHSVDRFYRKDAKFVMHDGTLKTLKQLLDKFGRPLWLPGLASGAPDTILNYPLVIDNSMAQVGGSDRTLGSGSTVGATSVLFGDLQHFIVRKVKEMSILRLDERYAEYGQVGFIAFSRVDSNLIDAGTHPINSLSQHS